MTAPMRDALVSRLYAALQHKGVEVGDVTAAVDAALATTGYDGLAVLAASAVAVQAIVGAEVGSPSPELAEALAGLETARETVASHPINGDLVVLP
ncbi:MAG TPA: hypothetical protein VEA44_16070 [Caulobacter sp.]|nr:hypothetical protein [Caulobacter sp.]